MLLSLVRLGLPLTTLATNLTALASSLKELWPFGVFFFFWWTRKHSTTTGQGNQMMERDDKGRSGNVDDAPEETRNREKVSKVTKRTNLMFTACQKSINKQKTSSSSSSFCTKSQLWLLFISCRLSAQLTKLRERDVTTTQATSKNTKNCRKVRLSDKEEKRQTKLVVCRQTKKSCRQLISWTLF